MTSAAAASGRILFLLAVLALPAQGLDPRKSLTQFGHDHWTMADGLPVTSVEVLAQTPDGYLWIGDEEGLARFDGSRFTHFNRRNTPGFANHDVRALAVRREGGLWVGTWRGLFLLEDGRLRAVPVIPENPFVVIESLFEGRDGTLWAGTQGYGLVRMGKGRPVRYGSDAGLPSNTIWALQEDRDGALWIGAKGGLARLSKGRIESFVDRPGLPAGTITSFALAPDGSLWIGGVRGLSHYRSGRFQLYTPAEGLPHPSVDSLVFDGSGALWLGTRGGLARFHNGTFSRMGRAEGLADTVVRILLVDHEGSLWIGTETGGLERLRDGRFTVFGRSEGLADDLVTAILEDRHGAFWVGTKRGLTRLADGQATTWTERDGLVVPLVTTLHEDRRGTLWVGTTDGLHRFDSSSGAGPGAGSRKFVPFAPGGQLFDAYISDLWEDPQGTLWMATDAGLARLSADGLKVYTTKDGMSCVLVNVLEPDLEGGLWLGTSGGALMNFRDGRFTIYGPDQGLSEIDVFALHQDPDGTLWIGTNDGGLNVLREGRIHAVSTRHGLFDDVVLQIVDDGLGALWLTSSRGISRVEKSQILDLVAGRRGSITPSVYDTADGLRSAECVGAGQPSAFRGADGRLWFSTMGGAAVLDPRRLGLHRTAPSVRIEQVLVNGEPARIAPGLRLAPGSRRVEIVYTAPTFLAPDRVRFRVKLEGFDRDWVEMGNRRTAVYTNLPPGDYRFHLLAANADGVWSREQARLAFELRPRFYQTPWFFALSAFVIALASWAAYRWHMRQVRLRYEGILAERGRIAGELHDTLAQNLAGLALQIEGTCQTLSAGSENPDAARDHLRRARDLVRESLETSRRLVWDLREEASSQSLAGALSRLGEPFTGVTSSQVAVAVAGREQPLPAAVESHLLRIGQEAVANAIRHGKAEHVRVQLRFEDGRVLLMVEDDGAGFSMDDLAGKGEGHFGLVGMSERARQLRGSLSIDSRPGAGTRVRAEVPLEGLS